MQSNHIYGKHIKERRAIKCQKCEHFYYPKHIDEIKRCPKCDHIHRRTTKEIEDDENNSIETAIKVIFS